MFCPAHSAAQSRTVATAGSSLSVLSTVRKAPDLMGGLFPTSPSANPIRTSTAHGAQVVVVAVVVVVVAVVVVSVDLQWQPCTGAACGSVCRSAGCRVQGAGCGGGGGGGGRGGGRGGEKRCSRAGLSRAVPDSALTL